MTQQNNTLAADVQQFIKNNYFLKLGEGTEILILEKNKFERVNHADTYNRYGLKIGHEQEFSDEETINTCLAYTYFDGNTWQTAIIADSDDFGMGFGYQQLDEENAQSIAEEFFKKEYSRKGEGTNEFVSENYTFIDSYCYGAWANWYVHDRVEHYA